MNWFERHLNWSLFLGLIYMPTNAGFTVGIPVSIIMIITALAKYGFTRETLTELETGYIGFGETATIVIGLTLLILMIYLTVKLGFWFLDRKGRSRGYVAWLIAPPFIGFAVAMISLALLMQPIGILVGAVIGLLGPIIGLIILLVLENRGFGYGGDLSQTVAYDQGPGNVQDTSQPSVYGGYDERLTKELDYTPSKNVLDISGGETPKGSIYVSASGEKVDSEYLAVEPEATPPAPQREKVVSTPVSQQMLKLPILLDDSGSPIKCAYHQEGDAVNMCSRCNQYVCLECNYITGTHPICRNCWEKRTVAPLAPPAQKTTPAPAKPEKQKATKADKSKKEKEPAQPTEPVEEMAPVEVPEPETPILSGTVDPLEAPAVTEVEEPQLPAQIIEPQKAVEPIKPRMPAELPVAPVQVPVQKEEVPAEKEEVAAVKEEPKIVVNPKAAKQEAEKIQWQQDFMALYQQASPIVNVIVKKSTDGMPASPLDLVEGLKLRSMLDRVKKLSKPRDKEMRQAKSELENLLSSCIKIADAAANFVSSGGQALLGGPDFKKIVAGIETAEGLLEKLSGRIPGFARPAE